MKRIIIFGLCCALLGTLSFPILVTDALERGGTYKLRFRIKQDGPTKRYVGLYTQKTLNADMYLYEPGNRLIGKFSGTGGKMPKQFDFTEEGVYTARVIAYSGKGPFLMVISKKDELKKILKDVK